MTNQPELPHSDEAEEHLLSCCLLDQGDTIKRCLDAKLPPGAFYSRANRVIFERLCEMHKSGKPVEIATLSEELKASGQLELVGGNPFLAYLIGCAATTAQAGYFLDKLKDLHARREALAFAERMRERACDLGGPPLSEIVSDTRTHADYLERILSFNGQKPSGFSDSVVNAADLHRLQIPKRECLMGSFWREGGQGFLFGLRGLGKTWLGIHMARCIAEGRDCGPWKVPKARRVLYVDGEMALDGLLDRDRALLRESEAGLFYLSHEQHFLKTGRGLNFTDPQAQKRLTEYCIESRIEALFLDNISCLFCGLRENESDDWGEAVAPWLLDLRRHRVATCLIHHAGRSGLHMRGTSKREDTSFWQMRLDPPMIPDEQGGARFLGRFTKNREGDEAEAGPWLWTIRSDRGIASVRHERQGDMELVRQLVTDGMDSCSDIACELGVSKGHVCKLAKRLSEMKPPGIRIDGKRYLSVSGISP